VADHTPGPWEVQRYTVNADGKEVSPWSRGDLSIKTRVVDRSGTRVADCHWTDARLIASAPDLLAALIAVLKVIDRADDRGCPAGALEMARAAIARAEGRDFPPQKEEE